MPRNLTRPATLRDVADAAGVSVATASKALSGGYSVRKETVERVVAAAADLQFSPNALAKSLHQQRTGTVGLLTSDLDGRFSIPVMMGAEDAFGSGRVSVFLCDARGDAIREQHHIKALLSRRIDGLILVGDSTNPRPSLGLQLPVPVVYAYAPSINAQDISVISDNTGAGLMAAEHLVSRGRRRIACIAGDKTFDAAVERVEGARTYLTQVGMEFAGSEPAYGAWTEEWGRVGVGALIGRGIEFDGLICGSDVIARGALDALREAGIKVPEAVSVVGHDNWDLLAGQARPPLTSIDMNLEALGKRAAELLFAAMDGQVAVGMHSVATRVVTRGSA